MSQMLILRGISGSSKTTFAKSLVGYTRVNRDDIRFMLYDGWEGTDEELVSDIERNTILKLLSAGRNVVVDNTNIEARYVNSYIRLAHQCGAEIKVQTIDIGLEEAIKRNAKRERKVPEHVIRKQHQRMSRPNNWEELDYPLTPFVFNEALPAAMICDIDGTLAHKGDRDTYDYSKVHLDTVDKEVKAIVNALSLKMLIVIVSGRDKECQGATESWLNSNGVFFDGIYMRSAGDKRADYIVKHELMTKKISRLYNVQFGIDDRPVVNRMWAKCGLKMFQVGDQTVEF